MGTLGRVLVLQGLVLACGEDGKGGTKGDAGTVTVGPASCDPIGKSVACTGPGGCAGAQVCQADGHFGLCDCGGGTGSLGGDAGAVGPLVCGAACTRDSECGNGRCIPEQENPYEAEGLEEELSFALFPGGMCSQTPLLPFQNAQACDPTADGLAQGCGSCGTCVPEFFSDVIATVCRETCTPSATDNGCSRDEYTCSFAYHACVEGDCSSDEECRVYSKDSDGNGLSDTLVYDADSTERCNMATRRCQVEGKAGAQAGDPCVRNDDCEADGACVTEASGDFEFPFKGGYCIKRGCEVAGLECAGEGECGEPRSWDPSSALGTVCVHPCSHGAEDSAAQLGPAGHGEGCRPGYMCMWNGTADESGACMPGNYNAVTANNVGAACDPKLQGAECFSPFGHGRCLTLGSQAVNGSTCSILDCGTPGLPEDVCGAGNLCVGVDDLSACFHVCQNASECAPGIACVELQGTDAPHVCMFGCVSSAECKTGETCNRNTGACVKS